MACECLNGRNECIRCVTIGYLRDFIGDYIQDSSGAVVHIADGLRNDYCPTYGELTGGTIIPVFVEVSGSWSNNVDGIIIHNNGNFYSNNQIVQQDDLSVGYTRFSDLSIIPSTPSISACGGSSTINYTYTLVKTEVYLSSLCDGSINSSAATSSDSTTVTYTTDSAWATINGSTVTLGKNDPNGAGESTSRTAIITGSVTFRGQGHTANATIAQLGLTGSYTFNPPSVGYNDYRIYDKGVQCNGSEFDCSGGAYGAIAYHTVDTWEVWQWVDECGALYSNRTENHNQSTSQETAYTYNGVFQDYTSGGGGCPGGQCEDSVSWDGYGSCSWTQICSSPESCDDYNTFGTITVSETADCTGGTVVISGNVPYTAYTGWRDEYNICHYNSTTATSAVSFSVNTICNTTTSSKITSGTQNHINYTITQPAGPCCTVGTAYTYADALIPCEAATNVLAQASYTAVTTDSCCNTASTTGIADYVISSVECNSGSRRKLELPNCPFDVYQEGSCVCCTCNDLTLSKYTVTFGCSLDAKQIQYTVTTSEDQPKCEMDITGDGKLCNGMTVTFDDFDIDAHIRGNSCINNIAIDGLDETHFTSSINTVTSVITITLIDSLPPGYTSTFDVVYQSDEPNMCSKTVTIIGDQPNYEINVIGEGELCHGNTVIFDDFDLDAQIRTDKCYTEYNVDVLGEGEICSNNDTVEFKDIDLTAQIR